jgi:hypothetical protein
MRSGSYFWVGLAMASAALFGASTPFAKLLLGVGLDPQLLAGLLYAGSGISLGLYYVGVCVNRIGEASYLREVAGRLHVKRRKQAAHMADIPGDNRWNTMGHGRFANHPIIKARAYATFSCIAAHSLERLRRR